MDSLAAVSRRSGARSTPARHPVAEWLPVAAFVLIHGAWHGAWCWSEVVSALHAIGHEAVAVELPSSDPESTFSDYAAVVADSVDDDADDVRLVAHSMGGMSAPLVASRLPVTEIAMVCALIPEPGRSYFERRAAGEPFHPPELGPGLAVDDQGRTLWTDDEAAARDLYDDCEPRAARAAVQQLRPQSTAAYREECPLQSLPAVRYRYLVCSDDRIVAPAWSRDASRERLGVEPTEWSGGHSPMLAQPQRLARWLADG